MLLQFTDIDAIAIIFICYYMSKGQNRRERKIKEGDFMKKNVGGIDKILRLIIGLVLLLIGFFMQMSTGLRVGAFVVAAIALITAFSGF